MARDAVASRRAPQLPKTPGNSGPGPHILPSSPGPQRQDPTQKERVQPTLGADPKSPARPGSHPVGRALLGKMKGASGHKEEPCPGGSGPAPQRPRETPRMPSGGLSRRRASRGADPRGHGRRCASRCQSTGRARPGVGPGQQCALLWASHGEQGSRCGPLTRSPQQDKPAKPAAAHGTPRVHPAPASGQETHEACGTRRARPAQATTEARRPLRRPLGPRATCSEAPTLKAGRPQSHPQSDTHCTVALGQRPACLGRSLWGTVLAQAVTLALGGPRSLSSCHPPSQTDPDDSQGRLPGSRLGVQVSCRLRGARDPSPEPSVPVTHGSTESERAGQGQEGAGAQQGPRGEVDAVLR